MEWGEKKSVGEEEREGRCQQMCLLRTRPLAQSPAFPRPFSGAGSHTLRLQVELCPAAPQLWGSSWGEEVRARTPS